VDQQRQTLHRHLQTVYHVGSQAGHEEGGLVIVVLYYSVEREQMSYNEIEQTHV
jgi:hypothetical protein